MAFLSLSLTGLRRRNDDVDGYENVTWICAASNFIALIPSRSIRQMLAILLELNSKGLQQSSGREKESCCLLFPSSTKREIRQFHVVVVQWRQRNVQKSVLHVQSCCFPCLNLLILCRSRCCRRRHCVSAPILRRRRRRQRKRQNINRIRLAKLHVQHAFLYLSLPSLHDYEVKMPIIMATFKIRNGESGNGNGNGNGNGEQGTGNL